MWDQLIVCYRLLDKKQVAQELVLERLKVGRHEHTTQHPTYHSYTTKPRPPRSPPLAAAATTRIPTAWFHVFQGTVTAFFASCVLHSPGMLHAALTQLPLHIAARFCWCRACQAAVVPLTP